MNIFSGEMMLFILLQEQEPWWVTLLAILVVFLYLIFIEGPKIDKRTLEEDKRYADNKGISVEELRNRRALRRARTIRGSVRKDVMKRDDYTCQYCGSQDELVLDHIYPFSRGGSNEADNLQVLCRDCNARKSDSIPDQFRS